MSGLYLQYQGESSWGLDPSAPASRRHDSQCTWRTDTFVYCKSLSYQTDTVNLVHINISLWRSLLQYGYSYKASSCARAG